MTASMPKEDKEIQSENILYRELEKGIADLEQGRIISHEESMQLIRDNIEAKLDEADYQAEVNKTRYTHAEVFYNLRKSIS